VPPNPVKIQAAKDAGKVSIDLLEPGKRARLNFRDYEKPGDNLGVERAERLGFVNCIAENGHALAEAIALAEKICANAPLAVREALAIINTEVNGDESEIWRSSHAAHHRLLKTEDVKEGVGAFFEKRAPKWSGT
jgi:enoyl-CoA hydratase/carnithine racemase